ncbi:MAG TPA: hypothetical protein ENJ32_13830 [Crenotrichaceae bacterium]|nr:hypothetical protein [Crenotrichaceae bacterium]
MHKMMGMPSNLSVSKAVHVLKGKSSYKLQSEFLQLKKWYWDQHLEPGALG